MGFDELFVVAFPGGCPSHTCSQACPTYTVILQVLKLGLIWNDSNLYNHPEVFFLDLFWFVTIIPKAYCPKQTILLKVCQIQQGLHFFNVTDIEWTSWEATSHHWCILNLRSTETPRSVHFSICYWTSASCIWDWLPLPSLKLQISFPRI